MVMILVYSLSFPLIVFVLLPSVIPVFAFICLLIGIAIIKDSVRVILILTLTLLFY